MEMEKQLMGIDGNRCNFVDVTIDHQLTDTSQYELTK